MFTMFFIYLNKLVTTHESIFFTFGLPVYIKNSHPPSRGILTWTFQFDLNFFAKILANLTEHKWKTRGPTKPNIEIINTINHHGK